MTPQLTTEQRKPVDSNCRINVCLACPGSGKTTVLVARALRLWHLTREPILVVTFSKKAAEEIIKRLGPENLQHIEVRTIHGFCYSIMKQHWEELGQLVGGDLWPKEARIATKGDELQLLHELFPEISASQLFEKFEEYRKWPASPGTIIRMFIQGVYFGKVTKRELEQWAHYESERISRGFITFNDMVDLAGVLTPLPYVSAELTKKYNHILIDEAQDTSDQQWAILRPLVCSATTTLVVGDYNQSIYGWRNADGSVLLNVRNFPDAVTFRLSQSFRSGTLIAKLANKLVYDKTSQIKAQAHAGKTDFKKFGTQEAEVSWVLDRATEGTAIISRTNSYLEAFERAAIRRGMAYSGVGFYRANHIRDACKLLREIGEDKACQFLKKGYIENDSYTKVEKEDFKLVESIIESHGLQYFLDLVDRSEMTDSGGFVLTTGHAAKGLEWDDVIVVGCHNGHIPHRLSRDDKEERNLLYVMTTRAKEKLTITCINEASFYLPKEFTDGTTTNTNL